MRVLARACRGAVALTACAAVLGACGGARRATGSTAGRAAAGEPVRYMPGGLRTIAAERLSSGGRLEMRVKRYGFQGRVYFDLTGWVQRPDGSSGGSDWRPEGDAPLAFAFSGDCPRAGANADVIVFGLLRAPADTVLAFTSHRPHLLRTAAIPASFHAGGVAAYAVLGEVPERILVRAPTGEIVMDEHLGHQGPTRCHDQSAISYLLKKR